MKTRLFPLFSLLFTLYSFAGVGVTKKQLDRTVSEINSNMSAAVSAEIGRNIDGHIERIGREAAMAATNYLPSFIAGLGEFADASRFALTDFTTNSLAFNDTFISNGVFVSIPRTAYFKAGWVLPTNRGFRVTSSTVSRVPVGTVFAIDNAYADVTHPAAIGRHDASDLLDGAFYWYKKFKLHCRDIFSEPLELVRAGYKGTYSENQQEIVYSKGVYDPQIKEVYGGAAYRLFELDLTVDEFPPNAPFTRPDEGNSTFLLSLVNEGGNFRVAEVSGSILPEGDQHNILGTFTLTPFMLNDSQVAIARNGTPPAATVTRIWKWIRSAIFPDAYADRVMDVFTDAMGFPVFRITWTTSTGVELGVFDFPMNRRPPLKKVNSKGEQDFSSDIFVPARWYTLADWCDIENWISFPVEYSICYADTLGAYSVQDNNGDEIKYSVSTRQMNIATFKTLFSNWRYALESMYIYPVKAEKKDPCREGLHSYVHCVCQVCGKAREHNFAVINGCARCVNEEGRVTVNSDNEIVQDWDSRSVCGFVPDGVEYHGGWRHVGRLDSEGYGEFCGCACGHYTDNNDAYWPAVGYSESWRRNRALSHLILLHDFEGGSTTEDWVEGDEHGNNTEAVCNTKKFCSRNCQAVRTVVEAHFFPEGEEIVEGIGDEDYHAVIGTCVKCAYRTETLDLHLRRMPEVDDGGGEPCVCIGGAMHKTKGCGEVHHKFVTTACGEVRCVYCLSYAESSPRGHSGILEAGRKVGDLVPLDGFEHGEHSNYGMILRVPVPNEKGHWCGCGLTQLRHNYITDPQSGNQVCPDEYPLEFKGLWWAKLGCGYVKLTPEETDGDYDLDYEESYRRGSCERRLKPQKGSSWFIWSPGEGEKPPTPDQLWPNDSRRPSHLPADVTRDIPTSEDYVITSLDFTYQMPDSPVTFTTSYEWDGQKWVLKKFPGWWDSDLWRAIKNSPLIAIP